MESASLPAVHGARRARPASCDKAAASRRTRNMPVGPRSRRAGSLLAIRDFASRARRRNASRPAPNPRDHSHDADFHGAQPSAVLGVRAGPLERASAPASGSQRIHQIRQMLLPALAGRPAPTPLGFFGLTCPVGLPNEPCYQRHRRSNAVPDAQTKQTHFAPRFLSFTQARPFCPRCLFGRRALQDEECILARFLR
jgi:hypothetical protein